MIRREGFSLLEVIVALFLLGLISAAVFAFISGEMRGQSRMVERVRMLGAVRRTVDTWVHNAPRGDSGEMEVDGFLLRWVLFPSEERRKLPLSGGRTRWVQLCSMRLDVFRDQNSSSRLSSWTFLVNRWQSQGSP